MRGSATFHLPAPSGERWTARAGQEIVGRAVRYGKLGAVGTVDGATPVDAGRSLRVHVELRRHLANPDRRKFGLAKEGAAKAFAKAAEKVDEP
jgi:hypothetical protein